MSENESYDLAVEWVVDQINDNLHDATLLRGETCEAHDLDACDCVPVDVMDGWGRRWQLVAVESTGRMRSLSATYTHTGSDKQYTRADHEADRADMAHSDGEQGQ